MRSGHCNPPEGREAKHGACRMAKCRCDCHDQAVRDKGAALVALAEGLDATAEHLTTVHLGLRIANLLVAAEHVSEGMGDTTDPVEALRLLHSLRKATAVLAHVDAALVQRAYIAGEHGDVRIDGLPPAKVTRGRERKDWDARGGTFAYLAERWKRHAKENGGDIALPPATVAAWVLDLVGVNYLRVTALRDMGLAPENFCESKPGKISVTFHES